MEEKNIISNNSKKHKIILLILVLLSLFIITFVLNSNTASKDDYDSIDKVEKSDEKKFSVTLRIDNGKGDEKKEYELNEISKKTTVFDILNKNVTIKYNNDYDYGVFIESIDGINNGDEGKYWQYYINNKLGDVAADKKTMQEGDIVEWRFEEDSF
ncbi:MAG: DUF4430 domain-containing protein [Patescibacteria group bacterium]|nr:DUF4430 domain-containing protein [Patescibacteria group bacterium]